MAACRLALVILLVGFASAYQQQQLNGGGYLQWSFESSSANYPFDSPYPPAVARGDAAGEDRVVTLSKAASGTQWNVSGLDIVTGASKWTNTFPFTSDGDIPFGLTTPDRDHNAANRLNLVLLQHQGTLYSLDGVSGTILWNWTIPANETIVQFAGWNTMLYMLIREVLPYNPDPYAQIQPQTKVMALNSADGSLRWNFNTTKVVPSQIGLQVQGALDNLAAGEGYAFYSKGNRVAAINATTGLADWITTVNIAGGAGQGQAANLTDIVYLQRSDTTLPPLLLTTSNNWSLQRFIMLSMNTTNNTAQPTVAWRTRDPETAMDDLDYARPIPDVASNRFYYWSNRTNWANGDTPTWEVYFVGKKLTDGQEVWSKKLTPLGVPASFGGRVYVVTDEGLMAMQGDGGAVDWTVAQPPLQEGTLDGSTIRFTYHTTATFGNNTGQLVAARCLGDLAPNLCMYSGFGPMPSAALPRWRGGGVVAGVIAVALSWVVSL